MIHVIQIFLVKQIPIRFSLKIKTLLKLSFIFRSCVTCIFDNSEQKYQMMLKQFMFSVAVAVNDSCLLFFFERQIRTFSKHIVKATIERNVTGTFEGVLYSTLKSIENSVIFWGFISPTDLFLRHTEIFGQKLADMCQLT